MTVGTRKYQEQFERVMRWYGLFKNIDEGILHDRSTDYYQDVVYAFFMNCYHLKDWIKNDPTVNLPSTKVEIFIKSNLCMKRCADICNGIKHLKLNKASRSGEHHRFGVRQYIIELGKGDPTIRIKYSIETPTRTLDAFKLATECVLKCEKFIKDYVK